MDAESQHWVGRLQARISVLVIYEPESELNISFRTIYEIFMIMIFMIFYKPPAQYTNLYCISKDMSIMIMNA